ncbi:uncharacterized protein LOC141963383 [Athene noctua]|uniref:uncharacterized protein LOC141963383 n=1 Tax=Athene noctua TaxID=126797 RepID=UPI003EBC0099
MVKYHWTPNFEFTCGSAPWICREAEMVMMTHRYPLATCSRKSPQCYTFTLRKGGRTNTVSEVGCFFPLCSTINLKHRRASKPMIKSISVLLNTFMQRHLLAFLTVMKSEQGLKEPTVQVLHQTEMNLWFAVLCSAAHLSSPSSEKAEILDCGAQLISHSLWLNITFSMIQTTNEADNTSVDSGFRLLSCSCSWREAFGSCPSELHGSTCRAAQRSERYLCVLCDWGIYLGHPRLFLSP